jgi:hypothetical protein
LFLTIFGHPNDAHIPYFCSLAHLITEKSLEIYGCPIKSITDRNGSLVLGSKPAIIGSKKYGPNLEIYINQTANKSK